MEEKTSKKQNNKQAGLKILLLIKVNGSLPQIK
jgi:hypothetical protein